MMQNKVQYQGNNQIEYCYGVLDFKGVEVIGNNFLFLMGQFCYVDYNKQ